MTIIKEEVAHTGLVGGADTALHSHNSDGGATIKAGTIITDGSGVGSVIFTTAFTDTNYAIVFGCEAVDAVIATWSNKAVDGFDIKTENDKGVVTGSAPVNWVAIPYSNP